MASPSRSGSHALTSSVTLSERSSSERERYRCTAPFAPLKRQRHDFGSMGRDSIVHLRADQGMSVYSSGSDNSTRWPCAHEMSVSPAETYPSPCRTSPNACAMAKATERFSAITRRTSIPSRYRMVRPFHTHPNRYRFFILEKISAAKKPGACEREEDGMGPSERKPSWST